MVSRMRTWNWKGVLTGSIWTLCLGGLLMLMSFINTKSREFACNELVVIIPGEQSFVERADIDELIQRQQGTLTGRTLHTIPIHEIERELRVNPFIEKAVVFMDMNGVVHIRIQQREAVLRVVNRAGKDFYLDVNGLKMPSTLKYAPRVLTANGFIAEPFNNQLDTIQTPLMADLFKTANYIGADSLWNEQVEQLYVNAESDIELVPRVGNQRIILGNADSIRTKFGKLMLFYKEIVPKTGWDAYQSVNLKFANQIVCERSSGLKKEEPASAAAHQKSN